jgi:hypothetical protein
MGRDSVPMDEYLDVRDRWFWADSLLLRLGSNQDPANVARIVAEHRRGYQGGARIDGGADG